MTDPRSPRQEGSASKSRSAFRLRLEVLEDRLTPSTDITPAEQYALELVNRDRADPAAAAVRYGVDLNEGLAAGTITADPKQPLAPDQSLLDAIRGHADWLAVNNLFQHLGNGGTMPWDRARDDGFAGFANENLYVRWPAEPASDALADIAEQQLFIDTGVGGRGHRTNLFNPDWRSGSAAFASNPGDVYEGQLFGALDDKALFLTGVVFNDLNGDNFYNSNEAVTGVTVRAVNTDTGAITEDTVSPAGSYALTLTPGTYRVEVSGPGIAGGTRVDTQTVQVGDRNVKLDFLSNLSQFKQGGSFIASQPAAATATTLTLSVSPSVAGQPVTFTAVVAATAGTPTGTVTFSDGGTVLGSGSLSATGGKQVVAFTTSTLPVGSHPITAAYAGTVGFLPSSAQVTLPVAQGGTAISLTATPATAAAGGSVSFTAHVAAAAGGSLLPTGAVTFRLGDSVLGTAPLTSGTATFSTSALPLGTDSVVAEYGGDGNFTGDTSSPVAEVIVPAGSPLPPAGPGGTSVVAAAAARLGSQQFAAGDGAGGDVRFFGPDGTEQFSSVLFPGFAGGVRVATADFNGDGVADIVAGTGPGGPSSVRVIDGKTQGQLFAFSPFESAFTGGVFVAAGDVNGDGTPDLIVTPDEGGGPRVRILSGKDFTQLADFFGIADPAFRGGARAAVGDVDGDGAADLIVAAGFGGGPRVAVFDGLTVPTGSPQRLFPDLFVFEPGLRNGVYVAAGDIDGDGKADLIVGAGPGGGPRVLALSGADLLAGQRTTLADFFAGDPANRGGVRVAAKDLDGDNRADLLTGPGEGGGTHLGAYLGATISPSMTPPERFGADVFPGFQGGVFVG